MLKKIKLWFGFPVANQNFDEVKSMLEERLKELDMTENKKAPAKKAPAKKSK